MRRGAPRTPQLGGAQPDRECGPAVDLRAHERTESGDVAAALLRLDLRLRLHIDAFREELTQRARDPYRGLCISDSEVDELLASAPAEDAIRQLLALSTDGATPRFARVARLFGLSVFEQDALLICLAPEVDLRYERLYAYLQDDATSRRPSVELIIRLLSPSPESRVMTRQALGPSGTLMRDGLLCLSDDSAGQRPLLSRPLKVDERVVEYMLGSDTLDARITSFSELHLPESDRQHVLSLDDENGKALVRLLQNPDDVRGPVVYLYGPPGTAGRATIRAACRAAGRSLLVVDLSALLGTERPTHAVELAAREAALQNAILALDTVDPIIADQPDTRAPQASLLRILKKRSGPTILMGHTRWEPAVWLGDVPTFPVEMSPPGLPARIEMWQARFNGHVSDEETNDLAVRYRLEDEMIQAVAAAAHGRAIWHGGEHPVIDDVQAAACAIAAPPMDGLAHRIEPRYGWEDIVLPPDGLAQLRELCARARHRATVLDVWGYGRKHARRSGLTALFAGPPGTGKTMSAEIVARELGLELYRIDLSAVVSKYIGETEKNLERIFHAADQGQAVLLFDEADALFGKRSEVHDAHDRYANVEVAYLLQRLEAYDGVAILTTNLRGNIDEAFLRRLDCVLEFPIPEEPERLQIWQRALPVEAPLGDDLDLQSLARRFTMAGGHIRNIALSAAFFAASEGKPIDTGHLSRGLRREYQKLGKLIGASDV